MKTLQVHRTADASILCIKTQVLANQDMGINMLAVSTFICKMSIYHLRETPWKP